MSLTYQPFANTPEIQNLSKELNTNVGGGERLGSAITGLGMILLAASRARGLKKLGLFISGGTLIYRAVTGRSEIYKYLNRDTNPNHRQVSVDRVGNG